MCISVQRYVNLKYEHNVGSILYHTSSCHFFFNLESKKCLSVFIYVRESKLVIETKLVTWSLDYCKNNCLAHNLFITTCTTHTTYCTPKLSSSYDSSTHLHLSPSFFFWKSFHHSSTTSSLICTQKATFSPKQTSIINFLYLQEFNTKHNTTKMQIIRYTKPSRF